MGPSPNHPPPVLVVSIAGMAARTVCIERTPTICDVARHGAGCFIESTVARSTMLPAPAAMLRSVDPSPDGIVTNGPHRFDNAPPSFLMAARDAGLSTAAVMSSHALSQVMEPTAATHLTLIQSGCSAQDDRHVVDAACDQIGRDQLAITFVSLNGPDSAAHGYGQDPTSDRHVAMQTDALVAELRAAASPDTSLIVTGCVGNDTTESFLVVQSHQIIPHSQWETFALVDLAPTMAELAGFEPHPGWSGRSLVGASVPIVERIASLLAELEQHSYGERLNMLEHSLQTAANVHSSGGSDAAILGGLLHDIGHVLTRAGQWGAPDHASVAARFLQPYFCGQVTDPIRLHVEAKRYLVGTEPNYANELSAASVETLRQQGGPFTPDEAEDFAADPMFETAVALRRADDAGKLVDVHVPDVDHYRPLLDAALRDWPARPVTPMWARDACRCHECRDEHSGQHLIDATDLDGWSVARHVHAANRLRVDLRHADGREHHVVLPDPQAPAANLPATHWRADHRNHLIQNRSSARGSLDRFVTDLAEFGIALVDDVACEPGEILTFVQRFGFVRVTNYGALFDVRPEAEATNLAFTSNGLPLHTDNPYRDPVPTVQLLHCLRAARTGGGSLFSDGFAAADQLRGEDNELFRVLTNTPVTFRFRSADADLIATTPLINLDVSGIVTRVTVNNRSMEPVRRGHDAEAFYTAYVRFCEILAAPAQALEISLRDGQLIAFDNRRVLHGRSDYSQDPHRHLQGCYADIDAVTSAAQLARAR